MSSICADNYFLSLSGDEMMEVCGGANIADWACLAGGAYSAVVGVGAMGWIGATAAAVCSAPVVAGSAAIIGVASLGYGAYSMFK